MASSTMSARLSQLQVAMDEELPSALEELRSGRKQGHWIWWVFPALDSRQDATHPDNLVDVDEAAAFLSCASLRAGYLEALSAADTAMSQHHSHAPFVVFDSFFGRSAKGKRTSGPIDAFKVQCSATLFACTAFSLGDEEVRQACLKLLEHYRGDCVYISSRFGSSHELKGPDEGTLAYFSVDWHTVSDRSGACPRASEKAVQRAVIIHGSPDYTRLRKCASLEHVWSKPICDVPDHSEVEVLSTKDSFALVRYDGCEGYVQTKYLKNQTAKASLDGSEPIHSQKFASSSADSAAGYVQAAAESAHRAAGLSRHPAPKAKLLVPSRPHRPTSRSPSPFQPCPTTPRKIATGRASTPQRSTTPRKMAPAPTQKGYPVQPPKKPHGVELFESVVDGVWRFPGHGESASNFALRVPPTQPRLPDGCADKQAMWLAVDGPRAEGVGDGDVRLAKQLFEEALATRVTICPELLDEIAQQSGVLCGKWLLHPRTSDWDALWVKIAKLTADGSLGAFSAKTSTCYHQYVPTICVYTRDYLDKGDTMRVGEALLEQVGASRVTYKADIYTHLDIFGKNKYGIPERIYKLP